MANDRGDSRPGSVPDLWDLTSLTDHHSRFLFQIHRPTNNLATLLQSPLWRQLQSICGRIWSEPVQQAYQVPLSVLRHARYTYRRAALMLGLSHYTVRNHWSRIYLKMGMSEDRAPKKTKAVLLALVLGIIKESDLV